jgi:hypothetical protein
MELCMSQKQFLCNSKPPVSHDLIRKLQNIKILILWLNIHLMYGLLKLSIQN